MGSKYLAIFAFALCMCATPVRAEVFSKDFFDVELFSLSKHTEDAFDAPAAVYIVSAEDIRRSGATTIPDALRMVPGMQVFQQQSGTWAISSRGFATQFTNKLLVLVDGRVVYQPLFSGVFWAMQDMPLENIDRIEVIRGPGGTIWGSNAVNGIINIITKKASSKDSNSVSTTFGADGEKIIDATHSGFITNGDNYRIYAHITERPSLTLQNGQSTNDNWYNRSFGFRYDAKHSDTDRLTVEGNFKSSIEDNFFYQIPVLTAPYVQRTSFTDFHHNGDMLTRWVHKLDADTDIQTQFYFDYDRLRTGIADWDEYTVDGDFQLEKRLNDIHQLTAGMGYRYDLVQQYNPSPNVVYYRNDWRADPLISTFLQDKIRLIPNTMFLTLGSKLEHNIFTGVELQPSAKLAYYPNDNQTIWTSVSRAVRSPSIGEEDGTIRIAGTPTGFIARSFAPGYESEELIAYEAGYRIIPYEALLLEATLFYNDYDKLRTSELGTPFSNVSMPIVTRNNGYGETHGIELNTKFQVNQKWRLQGFYSFMLMSLHLNPGAVDNSFAIQQRQTPTHQYGINSFYNITPDIEFDNNLYFTGKIVGLTAAQLITSYTRWDSRIGWHIKENIELSLIGQNLLNNRHLEYQQSLYSLPEEIGRAALVKLSLRF